MGHDGSSHNAKLESASLDYSGGMDGSDPSTRRGEGERERTLETVLGVIDLGGERCRVTDCFKD
jgi:hypothetical protein